MSYDQPTIPVAKRKANHKEPVLPVYKKPKKSELTATIEWLKLRIKEVSGLVSDSAKATTLISAPVGLYLLIAYISHVSGIFPVLDSSFIPTLLLIVGGFCILFSLVLFFFLAPIGSCYVPKATRERIRSRPLGKKTTDWDGKIHSEYLLFQAAPLCSMMTLGAVVFIIPTPINLLIGWALSVVLGLLISSTIYWWRGLLPQGCSSFRQRKYKIRLFMMVLLESL